MILIITIYELCPSSGIVLAALHVLRPYLQFLYECACVWKEDTKREERIEAGRERTTY